MAQLVSVFSKYVFGYNPEILIYSLAVANISRAT
jgi:hypothetical protein